MTKIMFYLSVLIWIRLITCSRAARILGIFQNDARSHFSIHEAMMRPLLAAGHEVTIIAPMTSQFSHVNYTIIDCRHRNKDDEHPWAFAARQRLTGLTLMLASLDVHESDCRHILKMENRINVTGNYDVMFVEMMSMFRCYLPLAKKAAIPVIGTTTFRSKMRPDVLVGNPRNPSILPTFYSFVHSKMSFYERIANAVEEMKMKLFYFVENRRLVKLYEELFPDQDPFSSSVSLLFINSHESILPRALAPTTINIGGINMKTAQLQTLPEHLKRFIKEAEKGVILFSLGSVTTDDALKPKIMAALVEAFAKIPQRVLWKFDGQIEGLSENVRLSEWLPQKEILAQENVKAFISHCGMSSLYEAIYFAKPMILMPVWTDQTGNAGVLMSLEVGRYLDFSKFTEMDLLETLNDVINNTKYAENMRKLSKAFKDEPLSPAEKVLFWTEYVLRHNGTANLRSVAVDMPMYQYLLLDIIAFVIIGLILCGFVIYFSTKFIIEMFVDYWKNLLKKKNKTNKEE